MTQVVYYCVCGRELEDNESICSFCEGNDMRTEKKKKKVKQIDLEEKEKKKLLDKVRRDALKDMMNDSDY